MKKTFVILPGLALVVFMAGTALQDTRESDELAAELARLDQYTIPVGGVILWWGTFKEIPENFEICDGRVPKARGATLPHRKPELRDRFPMGAPNEFRFRTSRPNEGGGGEAKTEPTDLIVAQLAKHDHEIGVGGAGHGHSISPKHKHEIEEHTHDLPDGSGFSVPLQVVTDPRGKEFLVKNASTTQVVANKAAKLTEEELKTLNATVSSPALTGNTGTGEGHTHDIDADDLRPAFTQFLFIIRVK